MADIIKFPTKGDGDHVEFMRKSLRGIKSLDVYVKITTVGYDAETAWTTDAALSDGVANTVRHRLHEVGIPALKPEDHGIQFHIELTAYRVGDFCYAAGSVGILELVDLRRTASAPVPGVTWSRSGNGSSDEHLAFKLINDLIGGFVEVFLADYDAVNPTADEPAQP